MKRPAEAQETNPESWRVFFYPTIPFRIILNYIILKESYQISCIDSTNDLYLYQQKQLKNRIMNEQKNVYVKYAPNVFVAKCFERYEKGDTITLTTKYGKEHECIVFNPLGNKDGYYFYSIVRADGYNYQKHMKRKADRYAQWANSAEHKSTKKWEESNEGKDFLVLAEPIKVGHHSEKRHRALIERNHNRMEKAVEFADKAKEHQSKAEYWESKANDINLSMPESVEYYEFELEKAKEYHEGLKSGKYERRHSYSLTYAKKKVNEMTKKFELANKLWG